MEYADEELLRNQKEYKNKQEIKQPEVEEEQNILDGEIIIENEKTLFSERELLETKISMWIPSDFEQLSKKEIKSIYPLGNSPKVVMGNHRLHLAISLNHTENQVFNHEIPDFGEFLTGVLSKVGVKNKIYASNTIIKEEKNIFFIEFTSQTLDGYMYNLMFACSIEDRVLITNISIDGDSAIAYKPYAKQMFQTFQIKKESKEVM